MPDEPIGSVTVDSSELEPGALPAPEPTESGEAAPSVETTDGRTTDTPLSVEELQEQVSRQTARAEKAEKASREFERRQHQARAEAERMRQDTLRTVESDIANLKRSMDEKIANSDLVTQAELDRRDSLLEQRAVLRQNNLAQQEHDAKRTEYGEKLREKTEAIGWTQEEHDAFLLRHSAPGADGKMYAFGNYTDLDQAFEAAEAFLHYETRDEYQNKVRETETAKADKLAKQKMRAMLPAGSSPKPSPPPDSQTAYKEAIMQSGKVSDPDSWF